MSLDRKRLAPEWQRAFAYVEQQVGGRVVAAERQPRWRPAWFLTLERDGARVPIYFRGARREAERGVEALRRECTCLELLERHGIPVPHVYGFCPDPEGIVMDTAPGRANLASAESEQERRAVLAEYMEILTRIHALPLADFESAGLRRPGTAAELARGDLDAWVDGYRKAKSRPEPLIEFVLGWLERRAPESRERASFLTGDAGQFLFAQSRVTALVDLELAFIGDPAADLGALLSRDLSEPLGDLSAAVRHYEATRGAPVDRRALHYHAVRFALVTPLACAAMVARPPAVADYVQYLAWYLVYSRCALELIAHLDGIELDSQEPPEEETSEFSVAHDALRDRFEQLERREGYEGYQIDALARLAEYLRRADRYGPALEARSLDDAAALLGRRPASWHERDAALETRVAANAGADDAELVRYFVRSVQRSELLLRPVMRELADAHMQIVA